MNQDQDIWMRVGGSDKTEQQIANLRQLTLILYILYASCWILGGLPAIPLRSGSSRRVKVPPRGCGSWRRRT